MRSLAVWLLLPVLAAGCGGRPSPPSFGAAEKAAAEAAVPAETAFALDMYGRLRKKEGNLLFSPYGISTTLAMTHLGARGQTADEIAAVLHRPADAAKAHADRAALLRYIRAVGEAGPMQLSTANSLWGQAGETFLPAFHDALHDQYDAELLTADFGSGTAETAVNDWVAKQTRSAVPQLIPPGMLTRNTSLVLANAVHFKADWATKFKAGESHEDRFFTGGDNSVLCRMMAQSHQFRYFDNGELSALELPYAGGQAMIVLLPRKRGGLGDLERSLNAGNLATWLGGLNRREVEVMLPRFRVSAELQLNTTLAELGMPSAFLPQADLSGLNGRPGLFVGMVAHSAVVDVTEEGTEAAAATRMEAAKSEAGKDTRVFRANHPFIFLIRDNATGLILFLGRLTDPTK